MLPTLSYVFYPTKIVIDDYWITHESTVENFYTWFYQLKNPKHILIPDNVYNLVFPNQIHSDDVDGTIVDPLCSTT